MYPTKFAELYFLLLLGAVVVAGIDARAAQAFDAEAINARAPGHPWCVKREGSGVPAACEYDSFLTCGMAAISAAIPAWSANGCPIRRHQGTAAFWQKGDM